MQFYDTYSNVLDQQQQQQFASIFLSYDNYYCNCVQPTNYTELEELAFPL